MDRILIKDTTIVTLGEQNRVLPEHDLLLEGGRVKRWAEKIDVSALEKEGGSALKIINGRGKVAMPGMINAHMHFYSTLVRGYGGAKPSADFRQVLENLWWKLDRKLTRDDVYYSALVMAVQAVKSGTTTLIDHHASPGFINGSLQEIAKAVRQTGLRASLCYEVSDRDGEIAAREGLEENAEFIKSTQNSPDDMLRALFGLHASFTVGDSTLRSAALLGQSLGSGFHVHVAEAASDQESTLQQFGDRVVPRFRDFGILGPKTIAAHCIHLTDAEMDILADTGTIVAHNPQSNLNNAVGIADVVRLAKKGITVGLGTDAMTVNMLEEVRVALFAQHLKQENPSSAFMEIANTLFYNNPKIAEKYWGLPLGQITEGGPADLVLRTYDPPTPFNESTVLGHLIYGLSQVPVDTTIVAGKVLMEDGCMKLDIDEKEMNARSRELAAGLWNKM